MLRPRITSICSILFLFVLNLRTIAQEFEFGEISRAALEQKKHPLDSAASAAVLFEQGTLSMNYRDGWNYVLEQTVRIKIYNKDGYDNANIELPYYTGTTNSDKERITGFKAYTYNLIDGKIEDEKVRNRDVFDEEVSEFWNQEKFTFPKVQDGSIIEYTFKIESPHISSLPVWSFQRDIPVDFSRFEINTPITFISYRPSFKGYQDLETTTDVKNGSIFYSASYKSSVPIIQGGRPSTQAANVTGGTNSGQAESKIKTTVHIARDLPKIEAENYVNNISNYITSVKYEIATYKGFGNSMLKTFSNSWEDVTESIYKSENFGDQLSNTRFFEDDIDQLISGVNDQSKKLTLIFSYIKSRMKWNKNKRLFCSDILNRVYKNGIGNSADINIMLTAMLNYAGVEAFPVVSSTISHGIPFSPTISGFNYVTSLAKIGDQYYHLDATEDFSVPNILPRRVLNWTGRIIYNDGSSAQMDLMPKIASKINTSLLANITNDGKISGQVREVYYQNFALNYRSSRHKMPLEKQIENLKESLKGTEISEYKNQNFEKFTKPVIRSYKFETDQSYVDKIGGKLYFSPMLFLKTDENPFKSETRKHPIDFTYPRASRMTFNISIPEGFVVDYLPEKSAIGLPNDAGTFQYLATANTNKIQLTVILNINANILPADYYPSLKEFFQSLVEKENEKIVLKKA